MSKKITKNQYIPTTAEALLEAEKLFSAAYAKSNKVSALIAQYEFSQLIKADNKFATEALCLLKNKKEMKKLLDRAENTHLSDEKGKIDKLLNNTSTVTAATIASAFMLISIGLGPFITPYIQPYADRYHKKPAADQVTKPPSLLMPCHAPFGSTNIHHQTTNNYWTINNYYTSAPTAQTKTKKSPEKRHTTWSQQTSQPH